MQQVPRIAAAGSAGLYLLTYVHIVALLSVLVVTTLAFHPLHVYFNYYPSQYWYIYVYVQLLVNK